MTRKFITIESADIDSRHQLRSVLEEIMMKKYGKKVMVIGTEFFPYDTFASNVEDCITSAANSGEISQYTVLFANTAIFSSINDKISKALNDDVAVICVGHLTQFTIQALGKETAELFGPIADCGLFAEPAMMIHLVHDEKKWEKLNELLENKNSTELGEFYKMVNTSYVKTAKNLESVDELTDCVKTICFEDTQDLVSDILEIIDSVLQGSEPAPNNVPIVKNNDSVEESSDELVEMDENDITFEEE